MFLNLIIELLNKQGINPSSTRWYVRRAEQYIKAYPGKKLLEHEATDVINYLQNVGRSGNILDWQFRQVVDAIRNRFQLVTVEWEKEFDWKYWLDSSQSLPESHRTITRETPGSSNKKKNLNNIRQENSAT